MYLVLFKNRKRADIDQAAYEAEAMRMEELAAQQDGFLSFKSYVANDSEVVAISEWRDEAAAKAWGRQAEHVQVKKRGRAAYYESYSVIACDDPKVHHFSANSDK